jgi:hypothetical protein
MVAGDLSLFERRPLAIKVTNFPRSVRPQWGLSQADHVYEYYLENLLTRFAGIFYGGNAERVGPVRSGRFFDEHIMRMYRAVLAFASADERVLESWLDSDLRTSLVIERPDNCPPLCRIGPEDAYNTLYADTALLSRYVSERGTNNSRPNLEGLRFERLAPFSLEDGARLTTSYSIESYNYWEYDRQSGAYLRYQDAVTARDEPERYEPLTDSLTGEQIAADNVIVLLVPHEYFINDGETEIVKMDFSGQGEAVAFRDGKLFRIRWLRNTPEGVITLEYPHGGNFPLKPGKTWFQVVGATSTLLEEGSGAWRVSFNIP